MKCVKIKAITFPAYIYYRKMQEKTTKLVLVFGLLIFLSYLIKVHSQMLMETTTQETLKIILFYIQN